MDTSSTDSKGEEVGMIDMHSVQVRSATEGQKNTYIQVNLAICAMDHG